MCISCKFTLKDINYFQNLLLMSPPKATRQSIQAPTFTTACFFCKGKENLILCETLNLDNNVRKMAEAMGDSKLLSKLAAGKKTQ